MTKTSLHRAATVAAFFAGSAALAAPPLVTFTSQFPWDTGYSGGISIHNDSATAIDDWVLTFTNGPSWSDMWNAQGSVAGGNATIVHMPWNATIAPGATMEIGFTGVGTLFANVTNCEVNGVPATVAYVGASGETSPLTVATSVLPVAGVGVPYAQTLIASGGVPPYEWSLASGALPSGIVLEADGSLVGTTVAPGAASFVVQVSDAADSTATRSLSLTVATLPSISIGDVKIALAPLADPDGEGGPPGFLSTAGNQIVDAQGNPVRITGVNWFGFETGTYVLHGLWTRNWKEMLAQVKALGFNTLRVPFSNAALRDDATTNSINFAANPDLAGLKPVEVLDKVVEHCGELGLRVLLDRHSAKADNFWNEDVWYIPGDPYYTEQRWIDDWAMLATRYAGNPTVIGADLFNEPKKSATWGASTPATDWNKAAERCGNAILAANPNWLIVVEGTEKYNGESTWWGGNLKGAAMFPVVLDVPGKLVYSMHDYPASVFGQSWFGAPDYPQNLDTIWHGFWGYLFTQGTAPLLLGEFGSKLQTTSDQLWLDTLTNYIDGDLDLDGDNDLLPGQQGMSWTYWSLNPNSSDTGGILSDDWITVNNDKMAYLQASLAPLIDGSGSGQPAQIMSFPVTLSAAPIGVTTVAWSTVDGTAVGGVDFVAASGTLTFDDGDLSKAIAIVVPPHAASETRTFTVQLSQASGATVLDASATGTISVGCLGDLDGSGEVDAGDLGSMLADWGQPESAADLDGSGVVDGGDVGLLLGAWGACAG